MKNKGEKPQNNKEKIEIYKKEIENFPKSKFKLCHLIKFLIKNSDLFKEISNNKIYLNKEGFKEEYKKRCKKLQSLYQNCFNINYLQTTH